jgi:uncharacterized protein RhaS with RHS repeats
MLSYYGYRYYSADMGRWLNRDPIGEGGGENLSAFVANDALNHNDLLGLLLTAAEIAAREAAAAAASSSGAAAAAGRCSCIVGAAVVGWELGDLINEKTQADETLGMVINNLLDQLNVSGRGWMCAGSCNVQKIKPDACCPDRVEGVGYGATRHEASTNMQKDANSKVPPGCYKRHCNPQCCRL